MKDPKRPNIGARKPLPRWKKVLLALAVLLFVAGAGLQAYSYFVEDKNAPQRSVSSDVGRPGGGLTGDLVGEPRTARRGGGTGDETDGSESVSGDVSPALMKGGLSFFIGFCLGYAVRAFFKVSALFIGVALLGYFGLAYAGILPLPDMNAVSEQFDKVVNALRGQAEAFKTFIVGNVPSAGLATAGLFTGFKK